MYGKLMNASALGKKQCVALFFRKLLAFTLHVHHNTILMNRKTTYFTTAAAVLS
ncbi:hypothetical protein QSI_3949 [Clostridioides difficile P28]|nr:hypothetical protein QSI_3949 [Clostridioides difficile P28]